MQITDTIADLLTRIRNASSAKHDTVDIPASNMKKAICQILVDEGYVKEFTTMEDGKQGVIKVTLKYTEDKTPVITGLRRVSKPGLRIYSNAENLPKVMKGLGIAIISTSKGIMTDRRAGKERKYRWRSSCICLVRRCRDVSNWKKTYKYSRWRYCFSKRRRCNC